MLIALGEKQYKKLREVYESEFLNVSWVDFESQTLDKKQKLLPGFHIHPQGTHFSIGPLIKKEQWIPLI